MRYINLRTLLYFLLYLSHATYKRGEGHSAADAQWQSKYVFNEAVSKF